MKRYRTIPHYLDTRIHLIKTEIRDDWDEQVKEQWHRNRKNVIEGYLFEFGQQNFDKKLENLLELDLSLFLMTSEHNFLLYQIRDSYVMGYYYPALVGACALGERLLNTLILKLRDYYKSYPIYKKIYKKDSFDNWDIPIEALTQWNIFDQDIIDKFKRLRVIRNSSVHYDSVLFSELKDRALESIQLIFNILNYLFVAFGKQPWFIEGTLGASYIKKESESWPFVKEFLIPHCIYVGHKHRITNVPTWEYEDNFDYPKIDVSDEEFKELINGKST